MKITIYFLTFFASLYIHAQEYTIKGFVKSNNEFLPFATVQVKGTSIGVTTDEQGAFEINNLSEGNYTLIASFVGFVPQKKQIKIDHSGIYQTQFNLTASSTLDEIVVTGTMKPTFVSASPIKIDVVTSTQLDTYLPTASSSIVESIQLINGVQEVIACGVCFTNSISINGLPGAYTAILMDGTPMYGNLASVYGLNGIPNMIIDRFEVIKGPSSTLYGSEAVAGVINIITKNPEKEPIISADLMTTSYKEVFGNIAYAPKIGKSTAFFGLNYAYVNDFEDHNNDGFGDALSLDKISFFSKINVKRKSEKLFSIAGKYYFEDRRNGVEAYLDNRSYQDLRGDDFIYGESIYTNRFELFGSYEFNTTQRLKLDYSLSSHDQDSYYGDAFYEAEQDIIFTNLTYNKPIKKHDVLLGLTARYNAYDDNTVATESNVNGTIENKPDNQFIPGVFAQDEWTLNQKWTFLGGVRLDHYSNHGLIFSPRINAKFKPSEWTTLRSNFGTGFRTVNLFTEDHAFVTGQREVIIEEELKPEQSYNISVNLNHIYVGLGGNGSIDLEGYYTYFTNKIIPDYDTPGSIIYRNTKGHAQTLGASLSINHSFRFPLSFNIGANLQQVTESEYDQFDQKTTNDVLFAPKWSGIFTANYNWKAAKMVFAYTAKLTGEMALPLVYDLLNNGSVSTTPRPTTSKPYSLHNIQITKTFNNQFTLYGGLENIFNFRQEISPLIGYNDPNTSPGFSPFFDTSYAYAPNHGTEVYLGLKVSLNR